MVTAEVKDSVEIVTRALAAVMSARN